MTRTLTDFNGDTVHQGDWIVSGLGNDADYGELIDDEIAWQVGGCRTEAKYEDGECTRYDSMDEARQAWREAQVAGGYNACCDTGGSHDAGCDR